MACMKQHVSDDSDSFPDMEAPCHGCIYNTLAYNAPHTLRTMVWPAIGPLTAKEIEVCRQRQMLETVAP